VIPSSISSYIEIKPPKPILAPSYFFFTPVGAPKPLIIPAFIPIIPAPLKVVLLAAAVTFIFISSLGLVAAYYSTAIAGLVVVLFLAG
jgi:hypothetical protein